MKTAFLFLKNSPLVEELLLTKVWQCVNLKLVIRITNSNY